MAKVCKRGLHQYEGPLCLECRRASNLARYHERFQNDLAYREKRRESNRNGLRRWRVTHPENLTAKWRAKNPGKWRARSDSDKYRGFRRQRRARKLAAAVEPFTDTQWQQVVDFYQGGCAYCTTGRYEHQDHVIPLSREGAHALYNLVPACATCNLRKNKQLWRPRVEHPAMFA